MLQLMKPDQFFPRFVQLSNSQLGYTLERYEEEVMAKENLRNALQKQHIFWKEKSRISWLKEGDRCTKFFYNYDKIKRAQSFIHSLNIDGIMVEDKQ